MRTESESSELGVRFFLMCALVVVALGAVMFVGALLFFRAVYAWGFLGAFALFALVLLAWAWVYDRRHPSAY